METLDAIVKVIEGEQVLNITGPHGPIDIPLSKNDANAVKEAFNQLLLILQTTSVYLELKDIRDDLFSQVAHEYLKQLNEELKEIHKEMQSKGLLTL